MLATDSLTLEPNAIELDNTEFKTIMQQAMFEIQNHRREEAQVLLLKAIEVHPQAPTPYFLIAAQYAHDGLTDRAEAAYIACLSRAPGFLMARFQLGLLQVTNKRTAAALASWEPLFALAENHYLRLFVEGIHALLNNDRKGANQLIEQGLLNNTENPPLNQDMQGILERLDGLVGSKNLSDISPAQNNENVVPEGDTQHFLISSYQKT